MYYSDPILTFIMPVFLFLKMVSAYYICCIYLNSHQITFTMKANTMNSDQTAVHIVCNIGYQSTKADEEQTTLVVNGRKMWLHVLGVSVTAKNVLGTCCFWCGSHWH